MLMIKLSKTGKANKKMFRLVISEKSRDPFGRMLDILGSYNPYTKDLQVKTDRIKHWLSKGAQMTPTVNNLLVGQNIIEGKKAVASKAGEKSEKRLAQIKAKTDKKSAPAAEVAPEKKEEAAVETDKVAEATPEEPKVDSEETTKPETEKTA